MICNLSYVYYPSKSNYHCFFGLVYEPHVLIVRVYHHPKETTNCKVVVDFQGYTIYIEIKIDLPFWNVCQIY